MKIRPVIAALIVIPLVALTVLFGYIFYAGPHMKVQPHIRAFQSILPAVPKGTVPVQAAVSLPTRAQAALLTNPVAATGDSLKRGRVYYRYYCVFCHGEEGGGNGPVGLSYMPKPSDLRADKVRSYHDGELLRAMLTGIGHEPVLEQVVPAEHRWYLVLYVRELGVFR